MVKCVLNFIFFRLINDLISSSILRYDYLKIINGNDELFGVVCGKQHGEDVIVLGNYVQLIFISDSEVQKKGFLISFTAVPTSGE